MEEQLNRQEERFLHLLETKAYEALTADEQALVQSICTPEAYRLQQRMLEEAPTLFAADAEPTPLVLPAENTLPFWKRPVPLYQAVTGIAATIALFFSIWPSGRTEQQAHTHTGIQTAKTDTVYRMRTVHDTVIRYTHRTITKQPTTVAAPTQQRILEGVPAIYVPDPQQVFGKSTGRTLKDDPTAGLLVPTTFQYREQ